MRLGADVRAAFRERDNGRFERDVKRIASIALKLRAVW